MVQYHVFSNHKKDNRYLCSFNSYHNLLTLLDSTTIFHRHLIVGLYWSGSMEKLPLEVDNMPILPEHPAMTT